MAFILITANNDSANNVRKGQVIAVNDTGVWGRKERLPKFLRIEITDATRQQIEDFFENINTVLQYGIVSQNPQRWRVRLEVDAKVVAATGASALRDEVVTYMEDEHEGNWTSTLQPVTPTQPFLPTLTTTTVSRPKHDRLIPPRRLHLRSKPRPEPQL